jgi:transposase
MVTPSRRGGTSAPGSVWCHGTILGKISKQGNRYLRVLFVQAAWVVLLQLKSWDRYGLKEWIEAAKKRLHHNVLAIALTH